MDYMRKINGNITLLKNLSYEKKIVCFSSSASYFSSRENIHLVVK